MALYIPRSIFHLARLLYVRPETFGPTLVCRQGFKTKSLRLFEGYHQDIHLETEQMMNIAV
jgi:hypothetical protein